MNQIKGTKKVSLFSTEAKSLLSNISLSHSGHHFNEEGEIPHQREVTTVHDVTMDTTTGQCNSCHMTFIDREDQVYT